MVQSNVRIVGQQGYPIVFLHGWGWHSGIWDMLAPCLDNQFQLFLIDLPGHGKNTLLSNSYNFNDLAETILPLAPPKAVWLGWSLGGMLAWWVAIHHPKRVSRLITIASSPKFVADPNWPGIPIHTLEKFSTALIENHQKTLEDFLELQLRGSMQQKKFVAQLKKQLSTTPPAALPALLGGLNLLKESDLRADLTKINCPSLHVFGELDTLVPARVIPHIQQQSPHARCEIIKRCGHIPFLTQQDEFLRLLHEFLHVVTV